MNADIFKHAAINLPSFFKVLTFVCLQTINVALSRKYLMSIQVVSKNIISREGGTDHFEVRLH